MCVGEQLDLDVARTLDVALAKDAVVTECRLGLASRRFERLCELGRIPDHPHSAAAAARCRLDDQREADLARLSARNDRYACRLRDSLRLELVAADTQRVRRRSDPDELRRVHRFGEVGVLGEEAVAGMDRIGTRLLGGADVLFREEVAADLHRLVRGACMERAPVVRGDDGNGLDPELARRAEDTQRDLAPVRDEQLADQAFFPGFSRFCGSNARLTAP